MVNYINSGTQVLILSQLVRMRQSEVTNLADFKDKLLLKVKKHDKQTDGLFYKQMMVKQTYGR
jgi:hypothetical protein